MSPTWISMTGFTSAGSHLPVTGKVTSRMCGLGSVEEDSSVDSVVFVCATRLLGLEYAHTTVNVEG